MLNALPIQSSAQSNDLFNQKKGSKGGRVSTEPPFGTADSHTGSKASAGSSIPNLYDFVRYSAR